MTTNSLLWITLIFYMIIMSFGFVFKIKWLYIIAGLLWFIPLIEIQNTWLVIVSAVMIITHFMLGLKEENDDF